MTGMPQLTSSNKTVTPQGLAILDGLQEEAVFGVLCDFQIGSTWSEQIAG